MLKVITLFTGIGTQEAALKRLGLDFEIVGIFKGLFDDRF